MVWINGEYYGFEWLEDYFDRTYLNNLYQSRPDEGSWRMAEPFREDDQELTEEEQQAKQDLQEVMSYYHYDLTDDQLYEELAARLDKMCIRDSTQGKQKNDTEIIKHLFCLGGFVLPHIAGERRNTAS